MISTDDCERHRAQCDRQRIVGGRWLAGMILSIMLVFGIGTFSWAMTLTSEQKMQSVRIEKHDSEIEILSKKLDLILVELQAMNLEVTVSLTDIKQEILHMKSNQDDFSKRISILEQKILENNTQR